MNQIQERSGVVFWKYDLTQSASTGKVAVAFNRQVSLNDKIRSTHRLPFSLWVPRLRFRHYKKIPADIVLEAREKLTKDLLVVVDQFNEKYKCRY